MHKISVPGMTTPSGSICISKALLAWKKESERIHPTTKPPNPPPDTTSSFLITVMIFWIILLRTSIWMQPAPAYHLGPVRMGLREHAWINQLCRVASHALFGPWMTQRIATGAGQAKATRIHRHRKRKLQRKLQNSPADGHLCHPGTLEDGKPRITRMCTNGASHVPSSNSCLFVKFVVRNYPAFISRMTATNQQDQITRSRGSRSRGSRSRAGREQVIRSLGKPR
jgi:hypothetical protein